MRCPLPGTGPGVTRFIREDFSRLWFRFGGDSFAAWVVLANIPKLGRAVKHTQIETFGEPG